MDQDVLLLCPHLLYLCYILQLTSVPFTETGRGDEWVEQGRKAEERFYDFGWRERERSKWWDGTEGMKTRMTRELEGELDGEK